MLDDADSATLLSADGPFADILSGFAPREAQQQMATAVEEALKQPTELVVEAGTGTGKTFAYLVPALISGKKVIISTGTKNLQDQLFHRDLPQLRQVLKRHVKTALLKGRSNYLCLLRLHNHVESGQGRARGVRQELMAVRTWASRTKAGDLSEIASITDDSPVLPFVTSSADNCLGQNCEFFHRCHLMKARQNAQAADIVVVNHHLFFADLSLRGGGFSELLPKADVVIFDEAHQLPETASQFFGQSISTRQFMLLARDTLIEQSKDASDMRALKDACEQVIAASQEVSGLFLEGHKGPWQQINQNPQLQKALALLDDKIRYLAEVLELAAPRSKSLEHCFQRAGELALSFEALTGPTPPEQIHWYETFAKSVSFHLTPLSIAKAFKLCLEQDDKTWIFTSATLAMGNDFRHYCEQMGLDIEKCHQFQSPFDYKAQSVLYLPTHLPDPKTPDYLHGVVALAKEVIEYSGGRCFLLFTSHRALRFVAEKIAAQIDYPVFVQGTRPKRLLLEAFVKCGNAVLFGTSSFWEGVDVRGEALSAVIIDKLPFAAPNDPVLQARIQALRKQGKDPFNDYQLPQAAIALKQGIGRLIRDVSDRGVAVICDPRLLTRGYGKMLLDALPPMRLSHCMEEVQQFYQQQQVV